MNAHDLLRGVGSIDDELILEADAVKFSKPHWGTILALAALLAVVILTPVILHEVPDTKGEIVTEEEAPADGTLIQDFPIFQTESIGDLKIGMTEQEILDRMREPAMKSNSGPVDYPDGSRRNTWFYKTNPADERSQYDLTLELANVGEGWFLNSISVFDGCSLTLSSGIGTHSTAEEVLAAYPQATVLHGSVIADDVELEKITFSQQGLNLSAYAEGTVDWMYLGSLLPEPSIEDWNAMYEEPAYNLTSGEITVYEPGGSTMTLVKKAAKMVCTTLTIMEPEEAETPEVQPKYWLDFHNGTVLAVYGDGDLATAYTCDHFPVEDESQLTFRMTGVFCDLDERLQSSMEHPTEDWD